METGFHVSIHGLGSRGAQTVNGNLNSRFHSRNGVVNKAAFRYTEWGRARPLWEAHPVWWSGGAGTTAATDHDLCCCHQSKIWQSVPKQNTKPKTSALRCVAQRARASPLRRLGRGDWYTWQLQRSWSAAGAVPTRRPPSPSPPTQTPASHRAA